MQTPTTNIPLANLPARLVHIDDGRTSDQIAESLEFRFPMPGQLRSKASACDFRRGSPQKNCNTAHGLSSEIPMT